MAFPNAPGVGFYPNDDQILGYLKKRVLDEHMHNHPNSMANFFPDIDLYQSRPSDIPPYIQSLLGNPNQYEWYFFCSRNGTNRRTVPNVGYWKKTGEDHDIISADTGREIGTKSILVFKRSGHSSSGGGENGSWVIHEYNLSPSYYGYNINQMPFVACCLKWRQ